MRLIHCWIVAALLLSASLLPAAEPAAKAPAALPKITISKETTYITEPLRADGYPDYVAALNQRMSAGVTPENNACVLLVEALGPNMLDDKTVEQAYRQLGMKPLPAQGNYLVSQSEIIKRWKAEHPTARAETPEEEDRQIDSDAALWNQFEQAIRRPWSAEELPLADQWLKANEKPLQLAVEASRRPKYYWPVITDGDGGLIAILLPVTQESRELARLLVAHAMLRAHEGKVDEAWDDLLACHRLARLVGQGFTLIDGLVSYAIDGLALAADCALAHHARISAEQAQKMRADLRALPPLPDMVERIDQGERYCFLDTVLIVARHGLPALRSLTDVTGKTSDQSPASPDSQVEAQNPWIGPIDKKPIIDWNVPLRIGNQWFDRLVTIGTITDRKEQARQLAQYKNDLRKLAVQVKEPGSLAWSFLTSRSIEEFTSPRMGGALVAMFTPALDAMFNAQQRTALVVEMGDTALALAAYRAEHEQYPEKLELLAPKYMAKVPEDTYSADGSPIRYRREGDAYVLWTVHMNGIDDNGRTREDDPPGDDHVLRPVPVKKN